MASLLANGDYDIEDVPVQPGIPANPRVAEKVYRLLQDYGDHYDPYFGVDSRARLAGDLDAGVQCSIATHRNSGAVVSHASICFDVDRPAVGLLGAVITEPAHRRRGLSKKVVPRAVAQHDSAGGELMVLGTGSAPAARVYRSIGFRDLAGGFDSGKKGYNPEDLGELIMLREKSVTSDPDAHVDMAGFQARYFSASVDAGDFVIEPLNRRHWAGLILLFVAFEGRDKFAPVGMDDGVDAEEAMLKLINCPGIADRCSCCVHVVTGVIHGISFAGVSYTAPGSPGAAAMLATARSSDPDAAKATDAGALQLLPAVDRASFAAWTVPAPSAAGKGRGFVYELLTDAAHSAEVAACHTRSWQLAYTDFLSQDFLTDELPAKHQQQWAAAMAAPVTDRHRVMVIAVRAEIAGPLVGFGCIHPTITRYFGLCVDNIHILPEHRRKGIATHLLLACRAWTRTFYPGEAMHLTCYASNAAGRETYDAAGGTLCDVHVYDAGDGSMNEVVRYSWPKP